MVKITVIADTHTKEPELPGGDILIHAGDLTKDGFHVEVIKQLNYLHEQLAKYTYVVLTPGNHDLWAERHPRAFRQACEAGQLILLLNEDIELEGLKIWAAPTTPVYHNWAFNLTPAQLADNWEKIPPDTTILVTHGPPQNILDLTRKGERIGCKWLAEKVAEIKPLVHAFGHVHESRGTLIQGPTTFVNAATTVINLEVDPLTRQVILK